MSGPGFALFETAIGHCGIVWSERGIAGVQLPESGERETRRRVLARFPAARAAVPPAHVRRTIDDIVALLGGERKELGQAILDSEAVPDFNRRVYDIARTIPPGGTLSYGAIAERLGDRNLARDVAQALGKIRFRSSCPVIASWRPAARPAAFRPRAGCAPSFASSPSRAPSLAARRCSPSFRWRRGPAAGGERQSIDAASGLM